MDKFLDRVRHRHAILKVATSCVLACGPLLASEDIQICLFTLDVIAVRYFFMYTCMSYLYISYKFYPDESDMIVHKVLYSTGFVHMS